MANSISFDEPSRLTEIFDAPHREEWQNTSHILRTMNISENAVIADVGAGTGYFSNLFAELTPKGLVYAIDAEPNMVAWMEKRFSEDGVTNITPKLCTLTDPKLPEDLDIVFVANTYRFIQQRPEYLAKIFAQISHKTKVVFVDFRGSNARVTPVMAMNEVQEAGFQIEAMDTDGCPDHYIMTFHKPLAV